jgi:hypothetical protein
MIPPFDTLLVRSGVAVKVLRTVCHCPNTSHVFDSRTAAPHVCKAGLSAPPRPRPAEARRMAVGSLSERAPLFVLRIAGSPSAGFLRRAEGHGT